MAISVRFSVEHLGDPARRKPTIYEALRAKLGREPGHRELCDDVRCILDESLVERAERGKLAFQRKCVAPLLSRRAEIAAAERRRG